MVALELHKLTKFWPSMRVQVDLKVDPGSLVALAGPSGCGKSTVLRMIAGLCPPDSGKIVIDGTNVVSLSPKDREVGMVFQDYALFPHLDVLANVAYGLSVRGIPRKQREALSLELLDAVGMRSFSKRRPHELSGGERQRIALVRTLATKPRVILFDEPLSSLDTALRKHLRLEIREQQKRAGLTALYVTHDLEEAMTMDDHVAIMDKGTILQCASPRVLWQRPTSVSVAHFLGSGPCLPVLAFEKTGSSMIAVTAVGRFGIPEEEIPLHSQAISPVDASEAQSPKVHIFFERTAAGVLTQADALKVRDKSGIGYFSAQCLRTDFAGDIVDCQMQAGGNTFLLRFSSERAPDAGESIQLLVETGKTHLIFG